MKKILTVLFLSLPAGAQAMGMQGHGGHCAPGIGVHLAAGLYAVLAALGYLVLQHAVKETAKCSKFAGRLVGWVLIAAGLGGLLCGIASHARMASCNKCCGGQEQMMQHEGMPGMMGQHEGMEGMPQDMEVMGKMKGNRENRQTTETKTAPAKKTEAAPVKK